MSHNELGDHLLDKARVVRGSLHSRRRLSIAVLGPRIGTPLSFGGKKRQQIREALQKDGHSPFFPEETGIAQDPLGGTLLQQGHELLSDPGVHLIILLHTPDSIGVLGELYRYYDVPEIESKMAVMVPAEFYTPEENVFGDTVQRYRTKLPYLPHLYETCQLVSECRRWAETMATGQWHGRVPFAV